MPTETPSAVDELTRPVLTRINDDGSYSAQSVTSPTGFKIRAECLLPSRLAPVRLAEGALSGPAEEHGPSADAVRAVEPVDGAQAVNDDGGSSPSEGSVRAQIGTPNPTSQAHRDHAFIEQRDSRVLRQFTFSSCSDFP